MYIVDWISFKTCAYDEISFEGYRNKTSNSTIDFKSMLQLVDQNTCSNDMQKQECTGFNGKCEYIIDAFYILGIVFAIVGFLWIFIFRNVVNKLQSYPQSSWKLKFVF